MKDKIITIRLNDQDLKDIEFIKKDVSRFFKTTPDNITTTQCIKYSIRTLVDVINSNNK